MSLAFSLIGAVALLQLLGYLRPGAPEPDTDVPAVRMILVLYGGLFIADLASLYGIWNWKRRGVYAMAGISIVSPFVELLSGNSTGQDCVAPFIQLSVLWFLIRDKWEYFE